MGLLLLLLLLAATAATTTAENWALLAAGSSGYGNYRHQSDVAAAFRLVTEKGGIAKENVVLMMADDIAHSVHNPVQGSIIHRPDGQNNWPAIKDHIDYAGKHATAANFLAALRGDSSAASGGSGRVLGSGADDRVFVYYSGLGCPLAPEIPRAPGIDERPAQCCFNGWVLDCPSDAEGVVGMGSGPHLNATSLAGALKAMHKQSAYGKLVMVRPPSSSSPPRPLASS